MTINRAGVIRVKKSQGTSCQCVVEGHTTYYYRTVTTFINPKLDKRGFLADHGEIDQLISNYYAEIPVPSCELMVQALAEVLAFFFVDLGMPPKSVFVEITSIPTGSQGFANTTYYPNHTA